MNPSRPWADLSRLQPGQSARTTLRVDQPMIDRMAAITGDDNPIHVDPSAAHAFGQSRPTAHGMILLGAISRLIGTELPGPGSIWFQNELEFLAPVFAGDSITVAVSVKQVSPATRVVVLAVDATKADGTAVAAGVARVRVPAPVVRQETPMTEQSHVVLITGASSGIGRVVAQSLGDAGMPVVVGYHANEQGAQECVSSVKGNGGNAVAVRGDVLRPGGVEGLVRGAVDAFGRVDVVVHAASPRITTSPFMETPIGSFREYHDAYVCALAELVQLTAPSMKERKYGRVITILSSAIAENPPKMAAYVTAKSAALALCRAMATELGPWNITVNAVSPSMVVGHRTDELGAAAREVMMRKTPLRRLAEAEDVAHAVKFLIGAEAGFISGANVPVTGGVLL